VTLDPTKRERLVEAAILLIGTKGYKGTTVEQIVAAAGVDRETFQHEFGDKEGCFLAIWDEITADYAKAVLQAYNEHVAWLDRLRAAAHASVEYLREHPLHARIGSVEVLDAGEVAQARRDLFLQSQVELVHAGRFELADSESVPRSAAEAAVGSIWDTLVNGIRRGQLEKGNELVPKLMYIAVLPYLGPEIATKELNS